MGEGENLKIVMKTLIVSLFMTALAGTASASEGLAIDHTALKPALLKATGGANDKENGNQKSDQENVWVCPMHPEVHQHEPGKCPVCKMKLIKAKPKSA